ncbi:sensor histidine kinase [Bhargavaea beijingensis]|uniref:histidine kinase n=1 Tax=Bhargavaea beijingensis TaxID=426756 RepID=A0ABX9ZDZ8_9BACL|nr:HAMP domain-containing sensor histidine kinase [Bhargavaea beijingensis]MCW1928062.1 HAMP domain-containing histidine kinase [Bhargavaea beijingensis]RSK34288.1 sensor histidine kinase [Bhargavaea beijingensis]
MKFRYLYQLIASHIGVLLIAFLVLTLLFAHFAEQLIYEDKTDELVSYGRNLMGDLSENPGESRRILGEYGRVLEGRDIQFSLFDPDSAVVYSSGRPASLIKLRREEWDRIRNGQAIIVNQELERSDVGVTFILLPYVRGGQFIGGVLLTSPISGSREVISELNRNLQWAMLAALAASLLLGWGLSAFHVKRLQRIRDAASRLASGDYSVRVPPSKVDEIGQLSEDFNGMAERLEESMNEIDRLENRRRQFIADVSHEMRTPLTTIRGMLDGLRDGMIREEERERALALAGKETRRLIRLVNENLDYEKIRSGQITLEKTEIPLDELLPLIAEQLEPIADNKSNVIRTETEGGVTVFADYDRLTQILINITKNSIQFTRDGTITLRGYVDGGTAVIEITDTGEGIDPEDVERIWERFYRAGVSRTSNPFGEFGLGLSIVRQLMKLHDGSIRVESNIGSGTMFTLRFPKKK